jgi:hypothetical protein
MRVFTWLLGSPFRFLFWFLALIWAILAAFEHDDDAGGAGPARASLGPAQKPFPILPFGFKWPGEGRS